MVDVIYLEHNDWTPPAERYLLVQCIPDGQTRIVNHDLGVTYHVPTHLFDLTVSDLTHQAETMGFSKLFVREEPEAQAAPAAGRSYGFSWPAAKNLFPLRLRTN